MFLTGMFLLNVIFLNPLVKCFYFVTVFLVL